MMLSRIPLLAVPLLSLICLAGLAQAEESAEFRVGVARCDITPPVGLPVWGYAARHAAPSVGTIDRLTATALVIEASGQKLALVATDLGRGPTSAMLEQIRKTVAEAAGISHVLVCGSHTHHGPVLELNDKAGQGVGKFDRAIAYNQKLPALISTVILDANKKLLPARIGISKTSSTLNRNRQAKKRPKITDPLLWVARFDTLDGKPIAILTNFAAHPTMLEAEELQYSADFPGSLRSKVEGELGVPCLFFQGAAGDLSANPPPEIAPKPHEFGELLGQEVLKLARQTTTSVPKQPSIKAEYHTLHFDTRVNLQNPLVQSLYSRAFFPELVAAVADEHGKGVDARLATVLLNGDLGLVAVSGEFFCDHANRLRDRLDLPSLLFLGYCNGHHFYFPTIEAASEGGYGAEPGVSMAELGAGERVMNQALIAFYRLMGRIPDPKK